ncbi:membrane bound O-acyl transferase family-domain-containing protein [Biscogniauxia marginata]|nr:membrane bound O-acyl transferase family-domain-containing protein [Biscogniauxia marginata]
MPQADQHDDVPLITIYRQLYRDKFWADVEAGVTKPFVLPLYLVGIFFLPTLYLTIPHKDRPWLYRARWLLLAFVVVFHFHMARDVSSMNFAFAYGVGLLAAWGTIWNFTLLVWTRPQWDAKRVDIRRKVQKEPPERDLDSKATAGSTMSVLGNGNGNASGSRYKEQPTTAETSGRTSGRQTNGHAKPGGHEETSKDLRERQKPAKETSSPPLAEAASINQRADNAESNQGLTADPSEQEFEYYWQEYPSDASFWTRLSWTFDIVTTMRMTGWNWAIPVLPPYRPPPYSGNSQLPLTSGPHRSKQGFKRTLSRRQLFLERLFINIIPNYLILDFCVVVAPADPYFLLGPDHHVPLPAHLASLHPLLLSLRRTAISFVAIFSALQLGWNVIALALAFPCAPVLGFRAHPWHLPTISGSFAQVLDRGLAGFWGAWWHQTFRFGFSAPARWLQRNGYLGRRGATATLAGAALAFLQSGLVHAAASWSTVPDSRPLMPMLFFALAGVGTVLQAQLARSLRPLLGSTAPLPLWARRLANLAFTTLWLWSTSWMLLDDFSRCGLWLFEPLPFSFFRALSGRVGGDPADTRMWRFDAGGAPRWYSGGRRWWESGVAI